MLGLVAIGLQNEVERRCMRRASGDMWCAYTNSGFELNKFKLVICHSSGYDGALVQRVGAHAQSD